MHQSMFWINGHSKFQNCQYQLVFLDKWVPYLDSLEPLGLGVMWCDVVGCGGMWCGGVGLVKVCIFYNQKMHLYLIEEVLFFVR